MNGDDQQAEGATNVAADSGTERGTSGTVGGVRGVEGGGGGTVKRRRRNTTTANTGNNPTNTDTGNDSTGTGNSTDTAEGQEAVSVPIEAVEFTTRRTRRSNKVLEVAIKPSDLSEVIAGIVYMIGQTREPYLQQAYNVLPEHCIKIAEPACRILERLPQRYLDIANNALDPIAMILASYALYTAIAKGEGVLNARYSAMVAEAQATRYDTATNNGTGSSPNVGNENPDIETNIGSGLGTDTAI